jgi:hypothetical protein
MIESAQNLPFPLINSPFYKQLIREKNYSASDLNYIEQYRKYGYVIIDDCIADETTARQIHSDCEQIKPGYGKNRVQDGWTESQAIRSVATNEKVLDVLRLLYGREPIPVQTLNFLRGTQQRTHSDVVHFSSLPTGFMCGAWTALEDITINQGPLHYYPESHNLPEFDYYDLGIGEETVYPNDPYEGEFDWDNPRTREKYTLYENVVERLMNEHGFKREALTLKSGRTLIWAANLFHGGNPILASGSTRKSQVTHFQFAGTIPWTPMFSNKLVGDYHIQGLRNICTGLPIEPTYNYMPVDLLPMAKTGRCKIRIKSGDSENDLQSFLTKEYSEALEFARAENALLRQRLEEVTSTQLWRAMEPIRHLAHRIKQKR